MIMKVLFVSNLFPNPHEPTRGIFNFHQVRHLAKLAEVRVVVPISRSFIRGRYVTTKPVPPETELDGLNVSHPVAWYLPSIGTPLNAWLYALSLAPVIKRIHHEFPFDVILANWAYPDACGMARIARHWKVPLVASISGSDVNVQMTLPTHRHQILHMLAQASATITRSQALKDVLVSHGAGADKIKVLYNGVDATRFQPMSRHEARKALKISDDERVIAYIGRLSPEKGVADLLEAMALLKQGILLKDVNITNVPEIIWKSSQVDRDLRARSDAARRSASTSGCLDNDENVSKTVDEGARVRLLLVGHGRQHDKLVSLASSLGLHDRIIWAGMRPNHELAPYYNAADVACVPSHMEGVPNTALEALACGIPVVGTRVGGIPEVLTDATGILVDPGQPQQLAEALAVALGRTWDRSAIVAHSQQFSWDTNARSLYELLEKSFEQKHAKIAKGKKMFCDFLKW
jgi:glycosyltransferase involved in cell wall biosynthesis